MIHEKVRQLKLRSAPITYGLAVDIDGNLIDQKPEVEASRLTKGYLIVWGVKDDYGTIFLKGCCSKSLQERGPKSNSKYQIKFLWQHDLKDPLCNFSVLEEDDYGLYFECTPDSAVDGVPNGDRAVNQIRNGTLNQFSVGFDYVWDKVTYDEAQDALVLAEIELYEGSVVTLPSNMETYAVRSKAPTEEEIEELQNDIETFLGSIPRKQQLQLRQLFSRHQSLYNVEPLEQRRTALKDEKPVEEPSGIDYKHLLENF